MTGRTRWVGVATRLTVAGAILGASTLGVFALHDRAGAGAIASAPGPVPVLASPARRETGYVEPRGFAGRLEPARRAELGFERDGRVIEVLVREGDAVEVGQPLARLDVALLKVARDRLRAERDAQAATVDLARVTHARQTGLSDSAVSAQRRDEARLELVRAEAGLAATEAALAEIEIDLDKSELRAPFAGHVAARRLDEGAIAGAGAAALDLIETAAPRARIGLAPDVAAGLDLGATYAVTHRGVARSARLAALRPDLDPATRTVVAIFDLQPDPTLAYGDVVEFVARTRREQPGYWLPLTALTEGERGLWSVYVIRGGEGTQTVSREAVRVVAVEGERVYVAGDLPQGAAVVRDGVHRVIPGQAVQQIAAAE